MTRPIRPAVPFSQSERKCFVYLPSDYERRKAYWLFVARGGANGAEARVERYGHQAKQLDLESVGVTPPYHRTSTTTARYPSLGEDGSFKAVLGDGKSPHRIREGVVLTGYWRWPILTPLRRAEIRNSCSLGQPWPRAAGPRLTVVF